MTRTAAALATLSLTALTLAGCSSTPTPGAPVAAPPSEQSEIIRTPELPFGSTHTFADGVTVNVSAPVRYERTDADMAQALDKEGPQFGMRVTVTVMNGSQTPIDPSLIIGSATLNGQPVRALAFAPAPQGELRHAGYTLLPGQTQVFDELYWLPGPGDLVLFYSHVEVPKTDTEMGQMGTAYFRGNVTP
jgi:hypothetical protein